MPESTRLRKPALLAGLLLLAAAGGAHATACQIGQSSLLYANLPSDFSEHGCYVKPSTLDPQPQDPQDEWKSFTWFNFDGKEWNGWHNHRYYRHGNDCSPVPLPASSWLLISGALAMLALGRRRRVATA